jgi:precorrin-4/cobalt-precorrin-4 C11-methyltransferase
MTHDGAFHRRRPRRARPAHLARARPHRRLFGLSLCRLACAEGHSCALPAGRAHRQHRGPFAGRHHSEIVSAHAENQDVARLHSGDLSIWSAMGEQLRRLRALGIPYSITPGVPSFAAAAAALEAELTLPGMAQSVVLTRTSGRASAMPQGETLAAFAATGAVLSIHLSVHVLAKVIAELLPHYGADCPVAVVWRASWPDERIVRATLGTLETSLGAELERTAIILVGHTLDPGDFDDSCLYAADYDRRYRRVGTAPRFPEAS